MQAGDYVEFIGDITPQDCILAVRLCIKDWPKPNRLYTVDSVAMPINGIEETVIIKEVHIGIYEGVTLSLHSKHYKKLEEPTIEEIVERLEGVAAFA